jgi:hypothetical protein
MFHLGLESIIRRSLKPGNPSQGGCGLNRKEKLFANLADHCQLSILQSLCKGAKTAAQIATTTGLSQRDPSFYLERLSSWGWGEVNMCGTFGSLRVERSLVTAARRNR